MVDNPASDQDLPASRSRLSRNGGSFFCRDEQQDIYRFGSYRAARGARHNAGHTATVFHPGGGGYANVASNRLMWTFKKDKKAGAMFVGKNCSLCTNANWEGQSKGIKG